MKTSLKGATCLRCAGIMGENAKYSKALSQDRSETIL